MYMLDLELIALVVREIFAGFRKYKFRSPKLSHVPFDLVFFMPSKLLIVVGAHTKFEVSSFCLSEDIEARILKI